MKRIFSELSSVDYGTVLPLACAMDNGIKLLLTKNVRVVGTAFTVKLGLNDNLMLHKAIYEAPVGSIIVVETSASRAAVAGGNVCAVAQKRGIAGFVVDGFIRDLVEIEDLGFPVFGRGTFPVPGEKRIFHELMSEISCGGVTVNTGDIVVGDREGIVVLPKAIADSVFDKARSKLSDEQDLSLEEWETRHRSKIEKAVLVCWPPSSRPVWAIS